jgi:hypothetical protein
MKVASGWAQYAAHDEDRAFLQRLREAIDVASLERLALEHREAPLWKRVAIARALAHSTGVRFFAPGPWDRV